jgi:hypothetical protein
MARTRRKRSAGLSEAQVNHQLYDAVAAVLHKHPQLCLNDVMARHRLALDITRKLHGRCVPPRQRLFGGR